MAYARRYGGGFVDLPSTTTPIDSAYLNAVETALLALYSVAPGVGQVGVWDGAKFNPKLITNAEIDPAAAIAKSKLGALSLVDADIAAGAAIALSKLGSAGQIGASGVTIGANSITLFDVNLYRSLVGPFFGGSVPTVRSDNYAWLKLPHFSLSSTANTSIPTGGAGYTKLVMGIADADPLAICSVANSYVIPPAGVWLLFGRTSFDPSTAGERRLSIVQNLSSNVIITTINPVPLGVSTNTQIAAFIIANGTDSYSLWGYQDSGAALNAGGSQLWGVKIA